MVGSVAFPKTGSLGKNLKGSAGLRGRRPFCCRANSFRRPRVPISLERFDCASDVQVKIDMPLVVTADGLEFRDFAEKIACDVLQMGVREFKQGPPAFSSGQSVAPLMFLAKSREHVSGFLPQLASFGSSEPEREDAQKPEDAPEVEGRTRVKVATGDERGAAPSFKRPTRSSCRTRILCAHASRLGENLGGRARTG